MTMQTQHTPGPLTVEVGKPTYAGYAKVEFTPPIFSCDDDGLYCKPTDAARVVLAWNCHDDLVAACEAARRLHEGALVPGSLREEVFLQLKAALAGAEPEGN